MFGTGDVKCSVGDGVYPRVAFYVQYLDSAEQAGRFAADGDAVVCAVSAGFEDGAGKDEELFGSVCGEGTYLLCGAEVCGDEISFGYEANAVFRCGQYFEGGVGCVGGVLFGDEQGGETARFFARVKGFFTREPGECEVVGYGAVGVEVVPVVIDCVAGSGIVYAQAVVYVEMGGMAQVVDYVVGFQFAVPARVPGLAVGAI